MKLVVRNGRVHSRVQSRVRSRVRWGSVILAALGIAAAVLVLRPEAPAGLQSSQPDRSAHVGEAPDHVSLDFASAPAPGSLAEVVVLGPEDENLARGPALTSPVGVNQPVAPLPGRGAYQVTYAVPLANGDVARGQYWFWYAPDASGSSSGLPSVAVLGLLLATAGALGTGLFARGRRRKSVVRVPAQRSAPTVTRTPSVPTQRSRDSHQGISPPGHSRPAAAPGQPDDEPTKPFPPRPV